MYQTRRRKNPYHVAPHDTNSELRQHCVSGTLQMNSSRARRRVGADCFLKRREPSRDAGSISKEKGSKSVQSHIVSCTGGGGGSTSRKMSVKHRLGF